MTVNVNVGAAPVVRTTIVALMIFAVLAMVGCEEATPGRPETTLPAGPTEPTTAKVVELVIAADGDQRVEQVSGGGVRSRAVTFPDEFNAGRWYDPFIGHWYEFASNPIERVVTRAEVLAMGGQSLDNGASWFLQSMEITPALWLNVRAILGNDDDASGHATLVVTVYANAPPVPEIEPGPAQPVPGTLPPQRIAEAEAVVRRHLATNAVRVRLQL